MKKEIANKMKELADIMDYFNGFKAYDFSDNTADELDELYSSIGKLDEQADKTHYSIFQLHELLDGIRVDRREEQDEADYTQGLEHRSYLNSWWNSTRV